MYTRWTQEQLIEEAKKYNTKKEWQNNCMRAYVAACKKNIIDICCKHMIILHRKVNNSELIEDAKKYKTRYEWIKESKKNYSLAQSRKILDLCCNHMKNVYKSKNYWTKEKLIEDAKKYNTRTQWSDNSSTAYSYARNLDNDFFELCCKHMTIIGNVYKKIVYSYEFSDNFVYIGLTCNEENRKKCHLGNDSNSFKSPVFKHLKKTGLYPLYKKITNEYIETELAQKVEKEYIKKYSLEGWKLLNKSKGGAIGKDRIWNNEMILNECKKYNTTSEWKQKSPNSYRAARKYKLMDECYLLLKNTDNKKWSNEDLIKDAKKYNFRNEWQKHSSSAYLTALRRKMLNECCQHMIILTRKKWEEDELIKDAQKYITRIEWKTNSSGYTAARKMKILDKCCYHMLNKYQRNSQ